VPEIMNKMTVGVFFARVKQQKNTTITTTNNNNFAVIQ
jgi:hypothetical protein